MSESASRPSASAEVGRCGVVAVIVRDRRFLVVRRSAHVVAPLQLCFPGGAIEADESEPQALQRELLEELHLPADPVERLWQSVTPWQVALSWWHCRCDESAPIVPNPAEIAEVIWMSAAEMLDAPDLLESNRQFLDLWISGSLRLAGTEGGGG